MRPKNLDEMRVNDLAIRIFILSTLFLSSCAVMSSKDYKYVETSMQTNLLTTVPTEQKPLIIKAKSDSDAYVKAYLNFCIAKKYYNKEFKKSGAKAGKPLSFRLLNEESIDITRSVSFLNKEQIEKNIEERVAAFELPKEKSKPIFCRLSL